MALGWGVRRFHNNIYMFSNPTEFGHIIFAIFWETTDRLLNLARQQKKTQGSAVIVFWSLINERSGRPRNAASPTKASIPEHDEHSNPVEYVQ